MMQLVLGVKAQMNTVYAAPSALTAPMQWSALSRVAYQPHSIAHLWLLWVHRDGCRCICDCAATLLGADVGKRPV